MRRPRIEQCAVEIERAADLAALEDFHTLGRLVTAGLAELTDTIGCHVTSVDRTAEYCDVARMLWASATNPGMPRTGS